jgi:hypothetical protein
MLSPQERRSIAAEIRMLDSTATKTSGTPATGDGKQKTKGSSLWPAHIRVVCANYEAGIRIAATASNVTATATSPKTAAASPIG